MSKLFTGTGASVSTLSIPQSAFITFMVNGENGLELLIGKAPVSGIRISEQIDMELNRALGNGWMLSTFGHKPISIVISGLDFYGGTCATGAAGESIQEFYDKYNVYDREDSAKITVGLSAKNSSAYTAVMVGLDREASAADLLDVGRYTLSLLAVKV